GGRAEDPGRAAGLKVPHRRRQGDRRRASGGGARDPAHLPAGKGLVDALLEAKRLGVKGERAILVGGRNRHAADLGDVGAGRHPVSLRLYLAPYDRGARWISSVSLPIFRVRGFEPSGVRPTLSPG